MIMGIFNRFSMIWLAALVAACGQPQGFRVGAEQVISDMGKIASCTHISHDAAGRMIVSWVEQEPGSDDGSLWYAVSEDGGVHFGKPVPVPTATGIAPQPENMPKIVFRKNGEAVAMFHPQPRSKE